MDGWMDGSEEIEIGSKQNTIVARIQSTPFAQLEHKHEPEPF
jgi:hypothetical protein